MSQLIKPQIKWTEEKKTLLKEKYPLGDRIALAKELGIKRRALGEAARRFGVENLLLKEKNKAISLSSESVETYYWHGFIMGDGNINPKGRISVVLSQKDLDHLEKLNNFIPGKIRLYEATTTYSTGKYAKFSCWDIIAANIFLNKYKITQPKTTNPPDLSCLDTKETFLPFFIGMFDADGCFDVRKSTNQVSSLKIEIHQNWKQTLELIQEKLLSFFGIESKVKYTSRGYIKLMVFKFKYLKLLKNLALEQNLPFLSRKWDLIDLNYSAVKNRVEDNFLQISQMVFEGKTWKQISEIFGVNHQSIKRRYFQLTSPLSSGKITASQRNNT